MSRIILFFMIAGLSLGLGRADWTQTAGPSGGSVSSLLSTQKYLFASTDWGIYRSANQGADWERSLYTGDNPFYMTLGAIGKYVLAGSIHAPLQRSADEGATWEPADRGLENKPVEKLGACGSALFAASSGKLFISRDSGGVWTPIAPTLAAMDVREFSSLGRYCYVASDHGLMRTVDTGNSWQALYTDPVYSLAVSGKYLFAGTAFDGMLRSQDSGAAWTPVNTGLLDETAWNPTYDLRSIGVLGGDLFVGTNKGMFHSANNGATWEAASNGLLSGGDRPLTFACAMAVSGSHIFAAYNSDAGIFHSSDHGQSWTPSSRGIVETEVLAMGSLAGRLFAASGVGAGVFLTTDNGATWIGKNSGLLDASVECFASKGNTLFAGTDIGIYRSLDSGSTWIRANSGLPGNAFTTHIAVIGENLFAAVVGANAVYRSTDNGATWSLASGDLPKGQMHGFAAAEGGLFVSLSGKGLFRSTDNGSTWIRVRGGLDTAGSFYAVAAGGGNIYAGDERNGIYHSRDNGLTWMLGNGLQKGTTVYDFAIVGRDVFAATNRNVFRSSDDGSSWVSVSDGFLEEYGTIHSLAVTATHLIAGTWDAGCWRIPLSEVSSSLSKPRRSAESGFKQGLGPWIKSLGEVEFEVTRSGWVDLSAYDVRGAISARLVGAWLSPGTHRASPGAAPLPAGTYFMRLRADGRTQTRRLTLGK